MMFFLEDCGSNMMNTGIHPSSFHIICISLLNSKYQKRWSVHEFLSNRESHAATPTGQTTIAVSNTIFRQNFWPMQKC